MAGKLQAGTTKLARLQIKIGHDYKLKTAVTLKRGPQLEVTCLENSQQTTPLSSISSTMAALNVEPEVHILGPFDGQAMGHYIVDPPLLKDVVEQHVELRQLVQLF